MSRLLFVIVTAWCCLLPLADEARGSTNVLGQVKRTLTKEPRYQSTPKYSLLETQGVRPSALRFATELPENVFIRPLSESAWSRPNGPAIP